MIYICTAKNCHYLFRGGRHETICPDCGGRTIRPAGRTERMEFFLRRLPPVRPLGRSS